MQVAMSRMDFAVAASLHEPSFIRATSSMSSDMEPVELRSDTRTSWIEASPAEVFAAISDPVRLARWWGPNGFTSTVHQFQFFPGGQWHLTLHGPDGSNYPNVYHLLQVEQDRLLDIDHPSGEHHFTLRIALLPQGAATVLAWRQTFDTVDAYRQLAEFIAQANVQVLERLSAEVRRPPGAA